MRSAGLFMMWPWSTSFAVAGGKRSWTAPRSVEQMIWHSTVVWESLAKGPSPYVLVFLTYLGMYEESFAKKRKQNKSDLFNQCILTV